MPHHCVIVAVPIADRVAAALASFGVDAVPTQGDGLGS